jgi:N-acetylmuramoyl-L-alanine amidase
MQMNIKFAIKTESRLLLSLLVFLLTAICDFNNSFANPDISGGYYVRTIVLDAGHGGKDPGCHGHEYQEKHVALAIVKELGKQIEEKYDDVKVIYTRDEDVFIPLHERAAIANRNRADLFISIHCNYIAKRNKAKGTETYVMGLHRAEENLLVAKRENASILLEDDYEAHYDGYDPDSPEGHIILSMYQNAYLTQSILLAHHIEENFKNELKRKSRGVKQAGFLVLRKTTMPSVLVETGFLSTDEEETFLGDPEKQKAMAASILEAINTYKTEVESAVPSLMAETTSQGEGEKVVSENDPDLPAIRFKIQLAASTKLIQENDPRWKGLESIEIVEDSNFYKYLSGNYDSLDLAKKKQQELTEKGFREAFVVAYKGDERISFDEALKLVGAN